MAERPSQSRILIPAPLNAFPYPSLALEQSKTLAQTRVFICPKYQSQPLTLAPPPLSQSGRKFIPVFEAFQLGHLFANRALSAQEVVVLARGEEEQRFRTPEREGEGEEKGWSSFKLVDTGTPYRGRGTPVEAKKARPKEKGLRKLSQRAYEIVLKMRSASYKEVANKLVDELNSEQELDQEGKDEQNIKRRVYDALNVLIALGVLRKEGRKIIGDRDNEISFEGNQSRELALALERRKGAIAAKKLKVGYLQQKLAAYRWLARKHHNRREDEGDQGREEDSVIRFPFMVVWKDIDGSVTAGGLGECNQLTMRWPRSEGDRSVFDIDLVVEFNKRLSQIQAP